MTAQIIQLPQARPKVSDDKPALADGYCRVVNALAEGLASHPITSVQQRVLWAVIRMTYGWNKAKDRIAASQLEEITGMREQHCSTALNQLIDAGVIIREGGSRSAVKINTNIADWTFKKKAVVGGNKRRVNGNTENGSVNGNTVNSTNGNTVNTKDRKDTYRKTTSSSSSPSENQPSAQESKSEKTPACPYQKIIDLYHQILPQLAEVQVLSEKRKSQIKARWQQRVGRNGQRRCDNLEFWEKYFNYVSNCPFLIGQGRPSGDRPVFFADLEWLTNASNFAKVIEGKYAPERGES